MFLKVFVVSFALYAYVYVITERANVTYINKKQISFGRFYTTRFGRRSAYYLNVEGENLHTWGNNVTFHMMLYEYLHNEYRRSFVEMHYKFCDFVTDKYVGGILGNLGFKCPAPPGVYHLMNMTVPSDNNFPYVWPFKKAKVEAYVATDTGEVIVKGHVYATFLDNKKKQTG